MKERDAVLIGKLRSIYDPDMSTVAEALAIMLEHLANVDTGGRPYLCMKHRRGFYNECPLCRVEKVEAVTDYRVCSCGETIAEVKLADGSSPGAFWSTVSRPYEVCKDNHWHKPAPGGWPVADKAGPDGPRQLAIGDMVRVISTPREENEFMLGRAGVVRRVDSGGLASVELLDRQGGGIVVDRSMIEWIEKAELPNGK
jgi:hypothetical protein